MDKVSYAIGMNIGQNLIKSGLEDVNFESLFDAIKVTFEKGNLKLSSDEANEVLQKFFSELTEKQHKGNIDAGKEYLAENAKRSGVITLASGLQYEVLQDGSGKKPSATDQVKCHYHGTLIDGTVFDSSVERDEPAIFPVNGVIQGWVEALQLMNTGSKWRLHVPSNLAYGERGAGGAIGPHSTLVFDVELIDIV